MDEDAGVAEALKPLTKTRLDGEVEFLITVRGSPDEIIHVFAEVVDEENRLREDVGAVEPTSSSLPPTAPPAPLDPCEG